jgi:hypothetical protein
MFFGSLVHQTLEDLHHYLIAQRSSMIPDDTQVEAFIRDALEQNFELLRWNQVMR